ncbi:MAG: type VI secretion system-associated FHA domain protein TagH, partial [Geminicoccales bacterium]
MRLILHLEGAGEQRPVTGDRFTVGRARENDWVLPDPDQHLSRQHCVIERRGDGFCVIDTSANGVFVNGATAPLGRGQERGLDHGDRLQLGTYAMRVEIEGAAASPARSVEQSPERSNIFDSTHVPKAAPKEGAGRVFDHTWVGSREELGRADHRPSYAARPDPRFQTPPEHRPVDLGKLAPEPGLFDTGQPSEPALPDPTPPEHAEAGSLFDSAEPAPDELARDQLALDPFAAEPAPAAVAAPAASPPPALEPPPAPVEPASPLPPAPAAPSPEPSASEAPKDDRLLAAFLAGAGLDAGALPIDDPEAFMRAAGARLRDLTEGLVQLLNARASVKNVARVERTTIGRDQNNPLKFSVTPQEALLAVLQARGPGFLSPEAAVRGGFRDIQEHELALLDAMQVALRALMQRFEPEGFERQLEQE